MKHVGHLSLEQDDTSPAAERRYLERLRATPPIERLRRALALSRQLHDRTAAELRRQQPAMTENEFKVAYVRRVYGEALAAQLAKRLGL